MRLTAAITPEDGAFVAQCLEVDVASQGDTLEEALSNLREALELYFEDAPPGALRASPMIHAQGSIDEPRAQALGAHVRPRRSA